MGIQIDQLIDDIARDKFGSVPGEQLDNQTTLHHDKHDMPLDVSLDGSVLTIEAAIKQKLESDGSDSIQNSYKWRLPFVDGEDVNPVLSTLDFSDGDTTGGFFDDPIVSPSMTASYYIQAGLELRRDGKYYIVWGVEGVSAGAATSPRFTGGAVQILIIKLQDDSTGGQWNFTTPVKSDIELMKSASGGGGGGAGGIGTLDIYHTLVADRDALINWTDNLVNATFDFETINTISGDRSYKITNASGASGTLESEEIGIGERSATKTNQAEFPYKYDGDDGDISVKLQYSTDGSTFYDVENSEVDLENTDTVTKTIPYGYIPVDSVEVKLVFIINVANDGKILLFNDISFSDSPFVKGDMVKTSTVLAAGNGATAITANVTNVDFTEISDADNAWDGTIYTVPFSGLVHFEGMVQYSAAGYQINLYKNGSLYKRISEQDSADGSNSFSFKEAFDVEDQLSIRLSVSSNLVSTTTSHHLSIITQAKSKHYLLPIESGSQTINISQINNNLQSLSKEFDFDLAGTVDYRNDSSGADLVEVVDDSGNTRTKFLALRACTIDVSMSSYFNVNVGLMLMVLKNDSNQVVRGPQNYVATSQMACSGNVDLEKDEWITLGSILGAVAASADQLTKVTLNIRPKRARVIGAIPTLYGKQYDLAITSVSAGWVVSRAVGIPYLTENGVWRLRFNLHGTCTAANVVTLDFTGVVFKTGYTQAVIGQLHSGGTYITTYKASTESGDTGIIFDGSSTYTNILCSGDVELDSKPAWAE